MNLVCKGTKQGYYPFDSILGYLLQQLTCTVCKMVYRRLGRSGKQDIPWSLKDFRNSLCLDRLLYELLGLTRLGILPALCLICSCVWII
ncbi:hypothetical protein D3C71_1148620 [compost metagenome]